MLCIIIYGLLARSLTLLGIQPIDAVVVARPIRYINGAHITLPRGVIASSAGVCPHKRMASFRMSRVFAAAGASDEDDYFDDDFCEKDDDEEDEDGEKDGEKANEGTGDGEAWQAGEAGGLDAPPSSSFPLAQSSFLSQPQWLNENDEDKDDWDYKRANSLKIPTSQLDLAMLSEGLDAHSHESLDGRSMLGQVDASAANNRYYKLVADLSPNVVLQKFAASAAPNVQAAVKSTIVSILGSLPNYVLDTSLITTNTKLANLMFQMEVTGYMLKNAEYRMSLTRSLKGLPRLPPAAAVTVRAAKQSTGGNDNVVNQSEATVAAEKAVPQPQSEKTSEQQLVLPSDTTELTKLNMDGVVRVTGADGTQVEIEAKDLTAALVSEVSALRKELTSVRGEREGDLRGNLLTYVQALPERELAKLTTDMSDDVMEAIELLVGSMMDKLKVPDPSSGQEVVVQQSATMLAQLCMWQMVLGYKLRELEALETGVSLD